MVLRSTRNLLFFLACPQMWVNPRKLKVAGLPFPRCFRLDATKRPNSIRRVLSGCNSNPNFRKRSRQSWRNRSASTRCWNRLLHVLLGRSSSLRTLRRRLSVFVRALRRYYTTVRLPTNVHIGLVDHHLLQPARSLLRVGRRWGLPDLARGVSMRAGVFDKQRALNSIPSVPLPVSLLSRKK
jgi:hypothetical protein